MSKKTNKKKIVSKNNNILPNGNFLLGSSADTNYSSINNQNLLKNDQNYYNKNSLKNTIHIKKDQVYNYAILNDDIVEEAALISSSEGGYDAEISLNSNNSDNSQINIDLESDFNIDNIDDEIINNHYSNNNNSIYHNYNGSNNYHYQDSIFSEISDSILLLEERNSNNLLKWYKRPSVFMISIILFLYSYSLGISMSPELQLVLKGVCYITNNNKLENCNSNNVQQANANLQKWSNLISSFVKILISIQMGKLSDIHGRKPLILFTFLMTSISRFTLIFALTPEYFSFINVILCSVIDSFGGSLFVLLGLANSYTIDVVHDRERLQSLGKVTGALFLGLSLGPLSSSILGSIFGIKSISLIAISTGLLILSMIIVILFIPESRSIKLKNKSRRYSVKSQKNFEENQSLIYKLGLSSFIHSFQALKLLWVTRPIDYKSSISATSKISNNDNNELINENSQLSSNTQITSVSPPLIKNSQIDMNARINALILLVIEILVTFCTVGASLPIALYLIYTFNFSQSQLGLFVGIAAGLRTLVLTIFNPWLQHYFLEFMNHDSFNVDFIDITSISFSIFCELVAAILCSVSSSFVVICVYLIFAAAASLGSPVIHSTLLKYNTSPGKNGEFFGALALIRNIINLMSPWLFLTAYSFGVGIGKPQIIFYIISFMFIIAAVLLGNLRFKNIF
jgi:MFS family permease